MPAAGPPGCQCSAPAPVPAGAGQQVGWHRRGRKADRLRPASVPRSARQRAQARPRAHPGRTAGSSTPPGRCKAAAPSISGCGAPLKSAIRRRSPPPTSSTCTRHTKQVRHPVITTAPCAGTLGAPPHRSEPAQRPCSRRNRKPFRAGGRVRPAGGRGGDNTGKPHLNRRRSRRGRRFLRPWPQHQHPRQVSHQWSAWGGWASRSFAPASSAMGGRKRESRGRVQGATHQPHATQIEARTKIPSALVPITTAAPSQPSAQHRSPTNHGLPGIEPEQPDSSSCTSCS